MHEVILAMKEFPASTMTTVRNHIFTFCLVAVFLGLNSLAYPQLLTHVFHHSHHTADTHSHPVVLLDLLCWTNGRGLQSLLSCCRRSCGNHCSFHNRHCPPPVPICSTRPWSAFRPSVLIHLTKSSTNRIGI